MADMQINDFTQAGVNDTDSFLKQTAGGTTERTVALANLKPYMLELTTKGDLLTRNASDFVRFPVGSDGQILKANSSESTGLIWGTVSSSIECTVGTTGADYTTLNAALAADCTHVAVITDITEVSDVTVKASTDVRVEIKPGKKIQMETFKFVAGGANANIEFIGGQLTTNYTVATNLFDWTGGSNGTITLTRMNLTIASSVDGSFINENITLVVTQSTIVLPNQSNCGIKKDVSGGFLILEGVLLQGGGANCSLGINVTIGGFTANRLILLGTWEPPGGDPAIRVGGGVLFENNIDGLEFITLGATVDVELSGHINNMKNLADNSMTANVNVKVISPEASFTQISLNRGKFDFNNQDNCSITDLLSTGAVPGEGDLIMSGDRCRVNTASCSTISDLSGARCRLENVVTSGAITISGEATKSNMLETTGIITISQNDGVHGDMVSTGGIQINGDRNKVTGRAGMDGGTGTGTVAFGVGANDNSFIGLVDAPLVDNSGTGTNEYDYQEY